MIKIPKYQCYREDYEDKTSSKLFYKFAVVLFIFYVFVFFCAQSFYANFAYITISGKSMQNTLNPNAYPVKTVVGNEVYTEYLQDGVFIRLTKEADYGDIIILKHNLMLKNDTIIKRVLGFEGDYMTIVRMEVEEGKQELRLLRVKSHTNNVEVIYEPYIKDYKDWTGDHDDYMVKVGDVYYERDLYHTFHTHYNEKTFYVNELNQDVIFFQVPEDNVFFLGDNRGASSDSRLLGTYEEWRIVGRVIDIIENGSKYPGNDWWWLNRVGGFIKLCWNEVLRFFGANG